MKRTLFLTLVVMSGLAQAQGKKLCVETKSATFCFDKTEPLTCEVIRNTSEKLCSEIGGIFESSSGDCFLCYE